MNPRLEVLNNAKRRDKGDLLKTAEHMDDAGKKQDD